MTPKGTMGYRWDKEPGNWNLKYENGPDNAVYDPELTFLENCEEVLQVEFVEYGLKKKVLRGIPVKYLTGVDGRRIPVATIYDLTMGQYGVGRGLSGEYPKDYDDKEQAYTPAWQEIFTGIGKKTVIKFAREWASTAEATEGKCMVIVGAAINHWFHGNLMYRASIMAQMLTGCNGKNGGGMNHYVGQEKLAPVDSWGTIMAAKDWVGANRLQQGPIWHYINSSQWRYDGCQADYNSIPDDANPLAKMHSADWIVKSVRNGWMPFYPQYNKSNLEIAKEAKAAGANTDKEIADHVVSRLKSGDLLHSVADPDDPVNFPRNWFIWRGNALMSSAKGHEYMLNHYLGTHHNDIADEVAGPMVKDIVYRDKSPSGKMDLVVDINFNISRIAGNSSDYVRYVEGTFSGVLYNLGQTDSVRITEGQISIVE